VTISVEEYRLFFNNSQIPEEYNPTGMFRLENIIHVTTIQPVRVDILLAIM
jgi:hypothetical protein